MTTKIIHREDAVKTRQAYAAAGKRVGFTSGVFDILHPGHVEYLRAARELVDVLMVGVNSDMSVRANKGPARPINSERERSQVLAGLSSVDYVFVFDERNNNTNVELLRPDVYIKAGDYSEAQLSSKKIVESYGGSIALVPFREGSSTTGVIEKIKAALVSREGPEVSHDFRPAVFLDRDGTINEHIEYLSDPGRFAAIPGAYATIKRLQDLGYRIIVVTNQPGIGLGYFRREDLFAVNREMMRQATEYGCAFDKIYYCPHSKADKCSCRKPGSYFIREAERELNIDLANSFVIGDMTSDVKFGIDAGLRAILVKTGRGGDDKMFEVSPSHTARDLADAAEWIAAQPTVTSPSNRPSVVKTTPQDRQMLAAAGALADNLGREYATIFGSILGGATLIEQRTSTEKTTSSVADSLELIRKASHRGLAISKKLEALSRAEEKPRGRRSLESCAKAVIELVSSHYGDECHIELVCPEDVEVEVADFTVVQMLLELCENSLEAMRALPERFILFHVDKLELAREASELELKPGSYARLSIVDHGDGLDELQGRGSLVPLSAAQVKEYGRGLALSMLMAKSVMKQHGGTVAIASRPQAGTNISLYFPLPQNS
jgi:rfaE bifunctional protein nucleotidyltransferase chain/domain